MDTDKNWAMVVPLVPRLCVYYSTADYVCLKSFVKHVLLPLWYKFEDAAKIFGCSVANITGSGRPTAPTGLNDVHAKSKIPVLHVLVILSAVAGSPR